MLLGILADITSDVGPLSGFFEGFESLAFASNLAMRSLGVAHSVGMLSYLLATLFALPPLLKLLEKREAEGTTEKVG